MTFRVTVSNRVGSATLPCLDSALAAVAFFCDVGQHEVDFTAAEPGLWIGDVGDIGFSIEDEDVPL